MDFQEKIEDLKILEQQHKNTNDPEKYSQIKEAKKKMDKISGREVEKKLRFLKQTYYERGPKATKSLARHLRNKQQLNTIHHNS